MIETERLILRPWRDSDRDDLARMCADPNVMVDYPAPQTRTESDVRYERYRSAFAEFGFCRWAVERQSDAKFIGYTGIQPISRPHPLAPGVEVGWRLIREVWGLGYASEAARASLRDGFLRCKLGKVYSFTAVENLRSQAVMRRIGLHRDGARDFVHYAGDKYVVFVSPDDWMTRCSRE